MTRLTQKNIPFKWTEEQQHVFEELKQRLISKPILNFPDYEQPFHLFTDASQTSMGAALMQEDLNYQGLSRGKNYRVIGYWSRIASAAEGKWPAVQL